MFCSSLSVVTHGLFSSGRQSESGAWVPGYLVSSAVNLLTTYWSADSIRAELVTIKLGSQSASNPVCRECESQLAR
jgi:hypothetical protein